MRQSETILLTFYVIFVCLFQGCNGKIQSKFYCVVRLSWVVVRTVGTLAAAAQDVAPC